MRGIEVKRYLNNNEGLIYVVLLFIVIVLGVFYWIGKNRSTTTSVSNQGQYEYEKADGKLVSDFPYFPEYPGSVVVESKMEGKVGDFEAHWTVDDTSPTEIMDWYVEKFEQEGGWEVVEPPPEVDMSEMFGVFGRKDKLYYLTVEGYSDTDEVEIQVEVIPKSLREVQ